MGFWSNGTNFFGPLEQNISCQGLLGRPWRRSPWGEGLWPPPEEIRPQAQATCLGAWGSGCAGPAGTAQSGRAVPGHRLSSARHGLGPFWAVSCRAVGPQQACSGRPPAARRGARGPGKVAGEVRSTKLTSGGGWKRRRRRRRRNKACPHELGHGSGGCCGHGGGRGRSGTSGGARRRSPEVSGGRHCRQGAAEARVGRDLPSSARSGSGRLRRVQAAPQPTWTAGNGGDGAGGRGEGGAPDGGRRRRAEALRPQARPAPGLGGRREQKRRPATSGAAATGGNDTGDGSRPREDGFIGLGAFPSSVAEEGRKKSVEGDGGDGRAASSGGRRRAQVAGARAGRAGEREGGG
ncbi:uncharacterized protein LOC109722561 [Ananas comosus]|uniref:Uncharacterized protein LOC109722561 n=1 Tax=Ananas comosus TaxID=4615 RepID=A0A6P5GE41_ANACO|nr:uncharacterized protein LOC109722561 [Ananas comosus]